jgi:hypothetical protein
MKQMLDMSQFVKRMKKNSNFVKRNLTLAIEANNDLDWLYAHYRKDGERYTFSYILAAALSDHKKKMQDGAPLP